MERSAVRGERHRPRAGMASGGRDRERGRGRPAGRVSGQPRQDGRVNRRGGSAIAAAAGARPAECSVARNMTGAGPIQSPQIRGQHRRLRLSASRGLEKPHEGFRPPRVDRRPADEEMPQWRRPAAMTRKHRDADNGLRLPIASPCAAASANPDAGKSPAQW